MNQVILVGEIQKIVTDEYTAKIIVKVVTPGSNGDNSSHLLPVEIGSKLISSSGYLNEDITIGVKAHIENRDKHLNIVADRITFIARKAAEKVTSWK